MAFTSRRNSYSGLTGGYSMEPAKMDEAVSTYVNSATTVLANINEFEAEIAKASDNIVGDSFEAMKHSTEKFKQVIENFNAFAREMANTIDERKLASLAHDAKYANLMDIQNVSKN